MFKIKNKKKIYPGKPQFYYIKVGCKGVFITRTCLYMYDNALFAAKESSFSGEDHILLSDWAEAIFFKV